MPDYIRQLSAAEVFRASYAIYFQNAGTLISISLLPTLPIIALLSFFQYEENIPGTLICQLAFVFVIVFSISAVTTAVGDICLQRPPNFSRSWQIAFRRGFLRLIWTQILSFLFTIIGMLFFIVPGIIIALSLMFSMSVITLENISGMSALKRSWELSSGYRLRNFGTLLLVSLPAIFVVYFILGFAIVLIGPENSWMVQFVTNVITQLTNPFGLVAVVIIYYEMRARKEAYDSTLLAQELMH